MISGNLARTVLTVLHHRVQSLADMQILLADVPQAAGIGVVWHNLHQGHLIEPVRGSAAYRLTPTGIRREKDVRAELPPQVRERLGLPRARLSDAAHEGRRVSGRDEGRHQMVLNDIVGTVRRVAMRQHCALRSRQIYLALPARPGGKNLDYSKFGSLLIELVEAGRLVWSGDFAARRYTVPEHEHLLLSPVGASASSRTEDET